MFRGSQVGNPRLSRWQVISRWLNESRVPDGSEKKRQLSPSGAGKREREREREKESELRGKRSAELRRKKKEETRGGEKRKTKELSARSNFSRARARSQPQNSWRESSRSTLGVTHAWDWFSPPGPSSHSPQLLLSCLSPLFLALARDGVRLFRLARRDGIPTTQRRTNGSRNHGP